MGSGKGKSYPTPAKPPIKSFNVAGSKKVRDVKDVIIWKSHSPPPKKATPNSVYQCFKEGNLTSERYYDQNGLPYLDVDYTNHGNSKLHPYVPHQHDMITDSNGQLIRMKGEPIT